MSAPAFNAGPTSAVLVEKGGRFFVYDPTLSVIAADDTVEKAYDKFLSAKRAYLDDVAQAGLSMARPSAAPAGQSVTPRHFVGELGLFLAKICIVFVLVGVLVLIAADQAARTVDRLASGIDQTIAPLKSISLADLAVKAADIAKDAQELPAEKKEELRRSIGTISRETAPFFDAWRNPPQAQPSTQTPADTQKQ
jgi:hypothetical protein